MRVEAKDLLEIGVPGGEVTEDGLRMNISAGIQYIESWLRGTGAAAINNLMEDAATAEISRSQVWQWIHHGINLKEGPTVTRELVKGFEQEELAKIRETWGGALYERGRFGEAAEIFERVALSERFVEFLTLPAYEYVDL